MRHRKQAEHQWNALMTAILKRSFRETRGIYLLLVIRNGTIYVQSKNPQEVIENGIRQYIGLFGIDDGIITVFDYFKNRYETKLDLEMLKQGTADSWTPSIRIDDITVS
jgi:hypothetical protein